MAVIKILFIHFIVDDGKIGFIAKFITLAITRHCSPISKYKSNDVNILFFNNGIIAHKQNAK